MPAFQTAAIAGADVPYLAFSQAREYLEKDEQYKLHYGRAMYRWCTRKGFDGFDQKVLDRIEDWKIGGNSKGRAVRSQDPDEGPLTEAEVSAITAALKTARIENTVPLREQAALAVALAFGSNSGQFASMREEDVSPMLAEDNIAGWIVAVPRHKKGETHHRSSFRKRKLNGMFGEIVHDLIRWNQEHSLGDDDVRPLFRKVSTRQREMLDDAWQIHITASAFNRLLKSGVASLGVLGRDGEPLKVTCRRFRYTVATRMVRNGASKAALIDVLDHSDDQNVNVYWEIHSDIVDPLDDALSGALAPRAQALAGIIRAESDAIRGKDPASRRYLADPDTNQVEGIGNCGKFGFCGITAPTACYTCVKFQAWMDGPHLEVLEMLLRARAAREEMGLHPKMVGIEDELIAAVRSTIARIERARSVGGGDD